MFKNPRKGTMVNPRCTFAYFKVTTPEGYVKFGIMVNNIRFHINEVRVFEPENFVYRKRKDKKLSVIRH